MSDQDVLGTVREALVREQEAFRAAEAARQANRPEASPTTYGNVTIIAGDGGGSSQDDIDDDIDDEGD